MDSPVYFTLHIQGLDALDEDIITSLLFEGGAGGVQENLKFEQKERTYQPTVIESESKSLIAYFEIPPSPDWVAGLRGQFPQAKIEVAEHEKIDWLQNWKDQWNPFQLIAGIWIVPDWHRDSFRPEGGECIYIEPGMAFGTGTHATTQLAAELLRKLKTDVDLNSTLDVGTGSGILAILASLLGFKKVFAFDNDLESKRVFTENLQKNPKVWASWCQNWSTDLRDKVQLTVANIIDGVLLDLKPEFVKVNSDYYIFTGILCERDSAFIEEMTLDWPLQVIQRLEKDEWVGYLMRLEK